MKAVAVKYTSDLPAPFLIAKGKDRLAEKIIELAENNGIHILKDSELLESCYFLEAGDYIPEELFTIIAEVYNYIYRTRV